MAQLRCTHPAHHSPRAFGVEVPCFRTHVLALFSFSSAGQRNSDGQRTCKSRIEHLKVEQLTGAGAVQIPCVPPRTSTTSPSRSCTLFQCVLLQHTFDWCAMIIAHTLTQHKEDCTHGISLDSKFFSSMSFFFIFSSSHRIHWSSPFVPTGRTVHSSNS